MPPRSLSTGAPESCVPDVMAQLLDGRMVAKTSLALFFSTLPSSGSLSVIVIKFLASLREICGGNGGTFGSVYMFENHRPVRSQSLVPRRARVVQGRVRPFPLGRAARHICR